MGEGSEIPCDRVQYWFYASMTASRDLFNLVGTALEDQRGRIRNLRLFVSSCVRLETAGKLIWILGLITYHSQGQSH